IPMCPTQANGGLNGPPWAFLGFGMSFLSPLRGWFPLLLFMTHGLRRGLHSFAPSELGLLLFLLSGFLLALVELSHYAGVFSDGGFLVSSFLFLGLVRLGLFRRLAILL